MKVLTESATYAPTVTVPEDGDAGNGADFELGYQNLADRTNNLKGRTTTLEGGGAAQTFVRLVDLTSMVLSPIGSSPWFLVPFDASAPVGASLWEANSPGSDAYGIIRRLALPHGAVLTGVRVGASQGASASHNIKLSVYQVAADKDSSPSEGTSAFLGSASISGSGAHVISLSGLTAAVDAANNYVSIQLLCSDQASATDKIFWLEVTFTHTDPKAGLAVL